MRKTIITILNILCVLIILGVIYFTLPHATHGGGFSIGSFLVNFAFIGFFPLFLVIAFRLIIAILKDKSPVNDVAALNIQTNLEESEPKKIKGKLILYILTFFLWPVFYIISGFASDSVRTGIEQQKIQVIMAGIVITWFAIFISIVLGYVFVHKEKIEAAKKVLYLPVYSVLITIVLIILLVLVSSFI